MFGCSLWDFMDIIRKPENSNYPKSVSSPNEIVDFTGKPDFAIASKNRFLLY